MKLLNYKTDLGFSAGIKTDKGVLPVRGLADAYGINNLPVVMEDIVRGGNEAVASIQSLWDRAKQDGSKLTFLPDTDLTYGPCVPRPGKVICVGLNYREHAVETGSPIPEFPVLFSKFDNAIAAHEQTIHLPIDSTQMDYEAELVIVIR